MAADEPTTETLRIAQTEREHAERKRAATAPTAADERAATRRADKATYLRKKLEEQADNPDDPG
jgi:hypothetical protein